MGHGVVVLKNNWQRHEASGGAMGKSKRTFILGVLAIVPVLET